MKLNALQLDAFAATAQLLNFTKAAQQLHITQSALSQRISHLESELETTLFIRDRTSVKLTEAGEKVLRHCLTNQASENELLNQLKNSSTSLIGTVRIGGFSSVNSSLLIPSLSQLMVKNPELSAQFITKEVSELTPLLRRSEADYILTTEPSDSIDIESILLGYEINVLAYNKNYPTTSVFLDHDINDKTTIQYLKHNKIKYTQLKRRYLDDIFGLIHGVKHGYGQAILPLHLIKNEKDIHIEHPEKQLKIPVYLQYFKLPYYRQLHHTVVHEIQTYFHKHLAQ